MYQIDVEYTDAKMRSHGMHLKCDNLEESQVIWESLVIVLNEMKRNGTLSHYAGFMDCARGEPK